MLRAGPACALREAVARARVAFVRGAVHAVPVATQLPVARHTPFALETERQHGNESGGPRAGRAWVHTGWHPPSGKQPPRFGRHTFGIPQNCNGSHLNLHARARA